MAVVKNICFTGTKCEKCAHFEVCQFKGDYIKAQADIQFFKFDLFDGTSVQIDECEWAKPLEIDCKFYSPIIKNPRGITIPYEDFMNHSIPLTCTTSATSDDIRTVMINE